MLTIDGVLYYSALTFLDATILIPLFLEHVSGSPLLIGLATAIRHLSFVVPQLFIAQLLPRIPRLNRFVFWAYLICRSSLLFVLVLLYKAPDSPGVLLAFFIAYSLFSFGEGVTQVPWMDVFGRTISPHNHGRLFGVMQSLGAVGAFAGGLVIQHVLARPEQYPYPTNFLIVFTLAFVLLIGSTLSFLYVRQGARRHANSREKDTSFATLLRTWPRAWRGHLAFRRLMIVQMLISVHQLALPFYILSVQGMRGVTAGLISTLVIAQIVGGMIGGLVLGVVSSRLGNRAAVQVTVWLHVAVPVMVLVAGQMAPDVMSKLVLGAFFTMGLISGGWIGFTNYLMEISTDETRGSYVAYLSVCTAPFALLPVFAGTLIRVFSFAGLIAIVLILLLVACWQAWRLPRTVRFHRRDTRTARSEPKPNAAPQ